MGQEISADQVPDAVKDKVAALFPNAEVEEWSMTAQYEAEFEINGREIEINLNEDGSLIQIEMEIEVSEVPKPVMHAVQAQYPDHEIKEAEQVELPDGSLLYELELEGENGSFEIHVALDAFIVAEGKDL